MSLLTRNTPIASAVDIDSLLHDSYLLVVELRQGASVPTSQELSELCERQIEHVRVQLKNAGLSRRSIELISHAQCALLDETVLGFAKGIVHTDWASKPLQARFFDRHQAGESLYGDIREVLREPAPDIYVLAVFQRVLMLGFQGRYRDVDDPERLQLLTTLTAHVAPMELGHALPTKVSVSRRVNPLGRLRSPLAQVAMAGLVLVAVWLGMDHLLGDFLATPLLGEA